MKSWRWRCPLNSPPWKGSDDMATRAKRADFAKFDRIMSRVPDVPPMPGDELPEGYEPAR